MTLNRCLLSVIITKHFAHYPTGFVFAQLSLLSPPAFFIGAELQLTFPIRDGTIIPAFRLEHNLSVSYHVFHLKDHVFQTLMDRYNIYLFYYSLLL